MVTYDLVVEPMSLISAFSLLDREKTLPSNLTEKGCLHRCQGGMKGHSNGFVVIVDIVYNYNKMLLMQSQLQSS